MGIQVHYKHVEGHQRAKYPQQNLNDWALLNEKMDGLAKAYLDYTQQWKQLPDTVDDEEWYLRGQGIKLSHSVKRQLDCLLRTINITQYWTKSIKRSGVTRPPVFTRQQLSRIDTICIQKAWDSEPAHKKRFICKMSVNQLATGRYMKRMCFWASDQCPRCGADNETTMHVIRCPNPSAQAMEKTLRTKLLQDLETYPTSPTLMRSIGALLANIIHDIPIPSAQQGEIAIKEQLTLEASEFLKGRVVQQWRIQQQEYLDTILSQRTARRWTQHLIRRFWDMFFQMWLHRNEWLHSNPEVQDKQHKIQEINQEIRRQWNIGTQGLHDADKIHFKNITRAQLLKKNRHYKQTWLDRVTRARTAKHVEEDQTNRIETDSAS